MKSPIDIIVDKILQAAEDSNFTAPLPEDADNFKKADAGQLRGSFFNGESNIFLIGYVGRVPKARYNMCYEYIILA